MTDKELSYEQKIRIRRKHAIAVLDNIGSMMVRYGDKNNNVIDRMHLEVGAAAASALGRMISENKVRDEDIECLTWLPKPPPPPVATAKMPKKVRKTGASDYRYEDRDNAAIDDPAGL
jgi:hypothetical protein